MVTRLRFELKTLELPGQMIQVVRNNMAEPRLYVLAKRKKFNSDEYNIYKWVDFVKYEKEKSAFNLVRLAKESEASSVLLKANISVRKNCGEFYMSRLSCSEWGPIVVTSEQLDICFYAQQDPHGEEYAASLDTDQLKPFGDTFTLKPLYWTTQFKKIHVFGGITKAFVFWLCWQAERHFDIKCRLEYNWTCPLVSTYNDPYDFTFLKPVISAKGTLLKDKSSAAIDLRSYERLEEEEENCVKEAEKTVEQHNSYLEAPLPSPEISPAQEIPLPSLVCLEELRESGDQSAYDPFSVLSYDGIQRTFDTGSESLDEQR